MISWGSVEGMWGELPEPCCGASSWGEVAVGASGDHAGRCRAGSPTDAGEPERVRSGVHTARGSGVICRRERRLSDYGRLQGDLTRGLWDSSMISSTYTCRL